MYWLSWKEHCSSVSVGFSWLMQAFAMFLVAMLSVCSRSKHRCLGLRISGAVILFFYSVFVRTVYYHGKAGRIILTPLQ